jgi:hypothetical protein
LDEPVNLAKREGMMDGYPRRDILLELFRKKYR